MARSFDRDLEARGVDLRLDLDRLDDPGPIAAVQAVYPEAIPVGRQPSFFEAARGRRRFDEACATRGRA